MKFPPARRLLARCLPLLLAAACAAPGARAAEFSVTPIRADLKPGALNETITVTNHSESRLRLAVRLMAWTQDAEGKDAYQESSDLVYFPRQLELEPGARRLVRVGAKSAGGPVERTYRLFIEEQPEPGGGGANAAVRFYFRFGVPVFVAPAAPRPAPEVAAPTLRAGQLSVVVRNTGNQHFRLQRVIVTDGADFRQELAGWYSLAGGQRTYSADIPAAACRRASSLQVTLEGEGVQLERKLDVAPADCG